MNKVNPDFTIDTILYPVKVGVFFTKEKASRWGKALGYDIDQSFSEAWAKHIQNTDTEDNWFLLYVPKGSDPSIICHEAAHMTFYILDYVGVGVDGDNHEAFCYLQEHLVKKLLEKV